LLQKVCYRKLLGLVAVAVVINVSGTLGCGYALLGRVTQADCVLTQCGAVLSLGLILCQASGRFCGVGLARVTTAEWVDCHNQQIGS